MRKRTTLLARIERIERQRQPRDQVGRRVVSIIGGRSDDEIVGFNNMSNNLCLRQDGEPIQSLIDRTFAVTGALFIFASYASEAAPERDSEAGWHPTPLKA